MHSRTKREYLRELVLLKNNSYRPLTADEKALGFLGWHERGYLPHCDYPGLVQLVTFRLADSMPAERKGEWEHLLKIEDNKEKRLKLEDYLDRGIGECHLRDAKMAALVEETLLHAHDRLYELLAWVVMPNHVHVLVHIWQMPLWKMVQRWKTYIATRGGKILRQERRAPARPESNASHNAPSRSSALLRRHSLTSFWQREYWDTYMRDEDQDRKAIRYIENNPVKAKFVLDPADFPFSSARYRDRKTWKLVLPSTGAPVSDPAPIERT